MKKLLLALSLLSVNFVRGAQDDEQAERSEIIQASCNADGCLKFCLIDHPEHAVCFPYSMFEYSFGLYGSQHDRAKLRLGEAVVYYNRHNGHTILSYSCVGFLHVGFIDKDEILQRIYLDGQEHEYTEMGPWYFKHIRGSIDEFRPHKKERCIIS
jgi:hypothetical protein